MNDTQIKFYTARYPTAPCQIEKWRSEAVHTESAEELFKNDHVDKHPFCCGTILIEPAKELLAKDILDEHWFYTGATSHIYPPINLQNATALSEAMANNATTQEIDNILSCQKTKHFVIESNLNKYGFCFDIPKDGNDGHEAKDVELIAWDFVRFRDGTIKTKEADGYALTPFMWGIEVPELESIRRTNALTAKAVEQRMAPAIESVQRSGVEMAKAVEQLTDAVGSTHREVASTATQIQRTVIAAAEGLQDHITARVGKGPKGRPRKHVPAIQEFHIADYRKWRQENPAVSDKKAAECYCRDLMRLNELDEDNWTDVQKAELKKLTAKLRTLIDADRKAKSRAKAKKPSKKRRTK